MTLIPAPLQNLVTALERLPGIGPKTASRLAFFLLKAPDDLVQQLAEALTDLKSGTGVCRICFNITLAGHELCDVCSDASRAIGTICVVEDALDVLALERTGGFTGRYHVLQGVLSPIEGIGPDDLRIQPLLGRVRSGEAKEVILATTQAWKVMPQPSICSSSFCRWGACHPAGKGLPVGGDLE